MKPVDLFEFCIKNLKRRRGRTLLTVVGVVVGVCAIVVLISLGLAVNSATEEMLNEWTDLTRIEVFADNAQEGSPALNDDTVAKLAEIDNVIAATPFYTANNVIGTYLTGQNERYQAYAQLIAIEPASVENLGLTLDAGALDISQAYGSNVIPVLVGNMTPFAFFDTRQSDTSPNQFKMPQYDDNYLHIVNMPAYENGVLQNTDDFFFDILSVQITYRVTVCIDSEGREQYTEYTLLPVGMVSAGEHDYEISNGFLLSIDNLKKIERDVVRLSRAAGGTAAQATEEYGRVIVRANSVENMEQVELEIKQIGYQISSMSETRAQLMGQVSQTQFLLGSIAAISLLVAAINIMNTMTMSIQERTKEIGVMKVLGCKLPDIRQMFLLEAGIIGLLGGLIGVAVSGILSFILNNLPGMLAEIGIENDLNFASIFGLESLSTSMPGMRLSVIPAWLVALALLFSVCIGLLSGLAPANRAMRISVLEAIRRE